MTEGPTDGPAPVGRFSHVIVDCADPERLAEFWCAALGVAVRGCWNQYIGLEPTVPGGPCLAFQQVPEAKAGKNRVHLDIEVTDIEASGARLEALGGSRLQEVIEDGAHFVIYADPEGNELCLVLKSD
jgi:catechol 2,3-dioxygenase-like lactoylglutathione lyase family enzyme